jgi:Carboxypeptidase regulatory-like domain
MRLQMFVRKFKWVCLIALATAFTGQIVGQAMGTIVGTITDSTGATIDHAQVTATHMETQIRKSVATGASGSFAIPDLAVGTYSVTVEAQGFEKSSIAGVTLDVSQQRNLDFKLTIAGETQVAEVTAAAPLINTADGSLAGLVTEQQVENLPLNGRSIQNLVMLQPGMAQDSGSMGFLAPQWISDGNRGETSVATLDGADATDSEMGTVQFWNFNLDAIAEFKVQQGNYSAQFGQGGGTVTQIVTKSGTNQFHGSAFEFIRNSVFDTRNYFASSVPPFQRNEFGGTFGGPIIRAKTFFFGEYAGFRQRLGEPNIISVPTVAERTGLAPLNGFQYQIPLNSVAQQVLAKYPLPNQPGGIFGANTYNFLFKQPTNDDQFSVRVDHQISPSDSLFVRASYVNNNAAETDPVAAIEDPEFSSSNYNDARNYAISETHIFSPRLVNQFLFSVNRQLEGSAPPSQAIAQTIFADGSLASYGPDTFITKYAETYYNPSDNFTWTLGRHLFNIGASYRYGQDNGLGVSGVGPNGQYVFQPGTPMPQNIPSTDGGPTLSAGTGSPNGLFSLLAGIPATYTRSTTIPGFGPPGGGGTHWGLRIWHFAGYVQDDVKATPKLTFNLGLRYEYASAPYEIEDRLGGIADTGPQYGHFLLNPSPLYKPQVVNLSPRLGAAYAVTTKTVVRGGFAVLTNAIPTVYPDQSAVDFPLASLNTLSNPTYSLTPLSVSLPTLTSTTGTPLPPNGNTRLIPVNTPVNLAPIAALVGNVSGYWPSNRLKNGYTLTGNLTVEQQLPGDMALQTTFVTNHALDLYSPEYPNAYTGAETQFTPFANITPGLGEFQLEGNNAVSHYNALQAQLRKISPTHGVQYQASYTWSKILTDADALFSASGQSGAQSQNDPTCLRCEYARASYDVAHRFIANFSYNIPGRWGKLPDRLSRGWAVLGIFNAQSGFPFNVTSSYGTQQYGFDTLNGLGARPFFIQSATKNPSHGPQFFSNAVINNPGQFFSVPTVTDPVTQNTFQTAPGNLGRNTYTGPGWWNFDSSLTKDTKLTEKVQFQLRAEFFNLFNHATFASPTSNLSNASFGSSLTTASAERQIQFGGRFIF